MPKYEVLANRHLQATKERDENGDTVTRYSTFGKGDTITLSEDEAERLVRAGGLAPVEDDEAVLPTQFDVNSTPTPQDPAGTPGVAPAATSGQTADEGLRGAADADGDSTAPDGPDVFEEMDYAALQAAARDRGLPAGGSKEDLKTRLREFTAGENEDSTS